MKNIVNEFKNMGYSICSVYLLDAVFLDDYHKYFSGVLSALSSMFLLNLPHINVLSKVDLIPPDVYEKKIDMYLCPSTDVIEASQKNVYNKKYEKLTKALANLILDDSMVSLKPLNIKIEESINSLLYEINMHLQFYDGREAFEPMEHNDGC